MVKIIHQTYKTSVLPKCFRQEWADSWKELNPEFEYRFWTDEEITDFMRDKSGSFFETWINYDVSIKKWDSWRWFVLKEIGGLYVDMDFACLKPISNLLESVGDKFAAAKEGDPSQPNVFCNAFMYSPPNSPFFEGVADDLMRFRNAHVLDSSACRFLTRRVKSNQKDFFEIKTKDIYPIWWNDKRKKEVRELDLNHLRMLFPDSSAITFWSGSWLSETLN